MAKFCWTAGVEVQWRELCQLPAEKVGKGLMLAELGFLSVHTHTETWLSCLCVLSCSSTCPRHSFSTAVTSSEWRERERETSCYWS